MKSKEYRFNIPNSWNTILVDFYDDNRISVNYNISGGRIVPLLKVDKEKAVWSKNLTNFEEVFPVMQFKSSKMALLDFIKNRTEYTAKESMLVKKIVGFIEREESVR